MSSDTKERGIVDDIANKVEAGLASVQDYANDVTGGATAKIDDAANDATSKYTGAVNNATSKLGNAVQVPSSRKPGYWCSFMILASAVLLGASTKFVGDDYALGDYCFSVAVVSLGLGLLMMLWYKLSDGDNSELRKKRFDMPLFDEVNLEMIIAAFFAVWWIVGACIITFEGPHTSTGNGYFAAWGGAFAAVGYLADASGGSMSDLRASVKRGQGTLYGLIIPSVVLIIATTKQHCFFGQCLSFFNTDQYHDEAAYGLSVGIISIVCIVLVGLVSSISGADRDLGSNGKKVVENTPKAIALVLVCLWIVACIILTFHEPFTNTGMGAALPGTTGLNAGALGMANGYFACWLGLLFSFGYAAQQFPELERQVHKANF